MDFTLVSFAIVAFHLIDILGMTWQMRGLPPPIAPSGPSASTRPTITCNVTLSRVTSALERAPAGAQNRSLPSSAAPGGFQGRSGTICRSLCWRNRAPARQTPRGAVHAGMRLPRPGAARTSCASAAYLLLNFCPATLGDLACCMPGLAG